MEDFSKILEDSGFGFVRLPRTNIKVLQLLSRDSTGNLWVIGDIEDLFLSKILPLPDKDEDIAIPKKLQGLKSNDSNGSIGLKLIEMFFGGGSLLGKLNKANKIIFSFEDSRMDSVKLIQLESFINDAGINKTALSFKEQLENGDIFIISDVLKTNKLSIEVLDSADKNLTLSTPEISDLATINANFNFSGKVEGKFSYEGEKPVVYGIRAVQIFYNRKKWWKKDAAGYTLKPHNTKELRGIEDFPSQKLSPTELSFDIK